MAKNSKTWLIVIVIAGFLIVSGMYIQKQYPIFALLASGYSAPADCKFITNVDPYTSRYTSYANSGAWVAVDTNGDGIKEKFGEYGSGTGTQACGTLVVSSFNTYGDSIYSISNGTTIRVATEGVGCTYTTFKQDYGAASNAVTSCTSSCVPVSCAANTCTGSTCTNNCGTVEQGTKSCTSGTCLITDTNSNSKMDRDELGEAINKWVLGI